MAGQRRRRIDERRDPRAIPTPAADGEALTRSAVCAMLDEVLLAAQDARRAVTVVVAEARGGVESLPPNLGEVAHLTVSPGILRGTGGFEWNRTGMTTR